MSRREMVWVKVRKPVTLTQSEKEPLIKRLKAEIEKTTKVREAVSRIEIRAGRVYLYRLFEPSQTEGAFFTVPLIDGKYIEIPYMRITLFNKVYSDCSLDWQRSDDRWMTIEEGALEECIQNAEHSDWFDY
jgi:hypothetical protein